MILSWWQYRARSMTGASREGVSGLHVPAALAEWGLKYIVCKLGSRCLMWELTRDTAAGLQRYLSISLPSALAIPLVFQLYSSMASKTVSRSSILPGGVKVNSLGFQVLSEVILFRRPLQHSTVLNSRLSVSRLLAVEDCCRAQSIRVPRRRL